MRTIKRLDVFLLKTFLPLFIMTFGICLFIFLMQFLWRYVDDMVGKGIDMQILAKLFFYAAMTFVPQALPLSILFACLMTFGNLGERLELLALKASGISLMRIMLPLIVFLVFVAISSFLFQNQVIPVSQVKMYTLLNSVRQKSPELEIPEQTFYSQMKGKNVYVRKKDKKKKLLEDVIIYDHADGFINARWILADSGRLQVSEDKKYVFLTLYNGESFQNLQDGNTRSREAKDAVPYRRESFDMMEMLVEFDGNFNMTSESLFENRYIGKGLASLQRSIDSMTLRIDSVKNIESEALYKQSYKKTLAHQGPGNSEPEGDLKDTVVVAKRPAMNFDSLYKAQDPTMKASLLAYSKRNIENLQMNYGYKSDVQRFEEREIRSHHAEMHKKFTLSLCCLIFFFIGAPLGAIIRKGGLGTPAVISVFLFVFYYVIERVGYVMMRDGVWTPWVGMWLSPFILSALGVFLTHKAVNDSVIMNAETYLEAFNRLIGKREYRKIEKKEIIMEYPDYQELVGKLGRLKATCENYVAESKRWLHYFSFWKQGGIDQDAEQIAHDVDEVVEVLKNSDQPLILNKTMDLPIIKNYNLINFKINQKVGFALALFFPIGGVVYLLAVYRRKLLHQDIVTTSKVCVELTDIINERNFK